VPWHRCQLKLPGEWNAAVGEFVRGETPYLANVEGEALANEDIGWVLKACHANASPLHKIRCRGEA
jgi:hypothetical protein